MALTSFAAVQKFFNDFIAMNPDFDIADAQHHAFWNTGLLLRRLPRRQPIDLRLHRGARLADELLVVIAAHMRTTSRRSSRERWKCGCT